MKKPEEVMITISDHNNEETARNIDRAVDIIDGWYNSDGFSESIQEAAEEAARTMHIPDSIEGLQEYADQLCQKIAELMGNKDFYGHGSYHVSAAIQGGFDLKIEVS